MKNVVGSEAKPSRSKSLATPPTWLVLAAFAAVYLIWGSTYLGIRLAIDSIPPLLMSGARFIAAGVVLYAAARIRGASAPLITHWRGAAIIGALLLMVGNGGVSWAEKTVPTNLTALIIAVTPLWIILIDWLRPAGRRPRALVFVGLALGFVGVGLIVVNRGVPGGAIIDPVGVGVILCASFGWALGSVFSRHTQKPESALLSISLQMIAGGLLLLLAGVLMGESSDLELEQITARSAWAFAYLTLFGSLVGFTAYVWLLQVSTPSKVATYAYVNPFIAVILGWLVLDEVLPPSIVLAGALIIASVVLITVYGTPKSVKDHESANGDRREA